MKNQLLRRFSNIPGGILLIPMAVSSTLYTFLPNLLRIGPPTESLFSEQSTMVLLGLILFVAGTQIDIFDLKKVYKKVLILISMKFILATCASFLFINYFKFIGIETITVVAVLFSTNPGYYLALSPSENKTENQTIFALLHLVVLPNIPLIILDASNGANIDLLSILSTFFPLILGFLIRIVIKDSYRLFSSGTKILMPFLGFSFGTRINLFHLSDEMVSGLILTTIFLIIIVLPMYFIEKQFIGTDGKSSLGMGTVAGLTLTVPLLANVPNQEAIISQISISIVLTSILIPIFANKLTNYK